MSWLFVALMAYAGVGSFLLPRLRGFRRFPDGAPILQWLIAVSVFMMGFLGTVLTGSPFWLMWVGFGISFAILICLSLQGPRSPDIPGSGSGGLPV